LKLFNKIKLLPTKLMKEAMKDEGLAPYLNGEMTTMKERRKDARKGKESKIILKYVPPGSGPECAKILPGIAKNISPGGMKIVIGEAIPPEAVVNVEFSLPEKDKLLELRGRVKWVWSLGEGKSFELGLEFIDPSSENLLDLIEFTYKK
jgi:hypothetical protein